MNKRDLTVLLVNPPVSGKTLYGKFFLGGAEHPPPSLGYIASYLLKNKKKVIILDATRLGLTLTGIEKKVLELAPDIVAFHVCTPNINTVKLLASRIKTLCPHILVIAGGPHFLYDPAKDIQDSTIDIIVPGEGEEVCLEIVEKLEGEDLKDFMLHSAKETKGIVFKRGGNIEVTAEREPISDIDTIPFPARRLFPPLGTYRSSLTTYKKHISTIMLTSRGCPFRCTFCHNSALKSNKVRFHSVEYVISEIDELMNNYNVRDITFVDDVFTVDRDRTFKICERLAERRNKLVWVCNISVGTVDKKLLKMMKDSGCWLVMVGIDSGSQEVLSKLEKRFTLGQAEELCNWCKEVGLKVHPNFIIGNPGESELTIDQTIRFAKKIYSHYPVFTTMVPYPGTKLWKQLKDYGELLDSNFDSFTFGNENPCFAPYGLTKEILIEKRNQAYRESYLNPAMILRHLFSIESLVDLKRIFIAIKILTGL